MAEVQNPEHQGAKLTEIAHPDSWMNGRWEEGRPGLPPLERRALWRTELERSPFKNISPELVDQHAAAHPVPPQVQAGFEEVFADCLTEGTDRVCHMLWFHPGVKRWVRLCRGPEEREWQVVQFYSSRCFDDYDVKTEMEFSVPTDWDERTAQLYGHLVDWVGDFRIPTREDFEWARAYDLWKEHQDLPQGEMRGDQVELRIHREQEKRAAAADAEDHDRLVDELEHYDYIVEEASNGGIQTKFLVTEPADQLNEPLRLERERRQYIVQEKNGYKVRMKRRPFEAVFAVERAKVEARNAEVAAAKDGMSRKAYREALGHPHPEPVREALVHELDARPTVKVESPEEKRRREKTEAIRRRREEVLG